MRRSQIQLKNGQIVQAQIEDVLGLNLYIASIEGQLLRVEIKCELKLRRMDQIWLEVLQRNPLIFKWLQNQSRPALPRKLDRNI